MGRKAQTWDDVGPTVASFMGSGKSETFFHKGGSSTVMARNTSYKY